MEMDGPLEVALRLGWHLLLPSHCSGYCLDLVLSNLQVAVASQRSQVKFEEEMTLLAASQIVSKDLVAILLHERQGWRVEQTHRS